MGKVVMVVRIMPSGVDVDIEGLLSKIREGLPEGVGLASSKIEPFVFGLKVLEAAFTIPDEEGYSDKVEEYLRGFPEVEEIDVVALTRL